MPHYCHHMTVTEVTLMESATALCWSARCCPLAFTKVALWHGDKRHRDPPGVGAVRERDPRGRGCPQIYGPPGGPRWSGGPRRRTTEVRVTRARDHRRLALPEEEDWHRTRIAVQGGKIWDRIVKEGLGYRKATLTLIVWNWIGASIDRYYNRFSAMG